MGNRQTEPVASERLASSDGRPPDHEYHGVTSRAAPGAYDSAGREAEPSVELDDGYYYGQQGPEGYGERWHGSPYDQRGFSARSGGGGSHPQLPAVQAVGDYRDYCGELDDQGLRCGDGVQTWQDGRRYAGQFADGLLNGEAVMMWPDGRRYIGQYWNNQKHGVGRFSWPDGRVYDGQWREGRKHGRGHYRDTEGYCGEYEAGTRHGDGVLVWSDGKRYSGEFRHGEFHGLAVMRWPDGRSYIGQYHRNRKHGDGRFIWQDGRVYDGTWYAGMRHGRARYRDDYGRNHETVWHEDRQVSTTPIDADLSKLTGAGPPIDADGRLAREERTWLGLPPRREEDPQGHKLVSLAALVPPGTLAALARNSSQEWRDLASSGRRHHGREARQAREAQAPRGTDHRRVKGRREVPEHSPMPPERPERSPPPAAEVSEQASRGDSRGESRGESRSESRGDSRGESRGESIVESRTRQDLDMWGPSDARGDRRGERRGERRGDRRGERRGDGRGEGRGEVRGEGLGDSRGQGREGRSRDPAATGRTHPSAQEVGQQVNPNMQEMRPATDRRALSEPPGLVPSALDALQSQQVQQQVPPLEGVGQPVSRAGTSSLGAERRAIRRGYTADGVKEKK